MRKRTLGAVLLAGLALSGAGAFTASNTFTNTSNVAGYGANTVTGATVSAVHYVTSTVDPSLLTSVVFTTNEDVSAKTSALTLRSGLNGATLVSGPYSCSSTYTAPVVSAGVTTSPGYSTVTCNTSPNPALTSFTSVGLTVTQ